MYSRFVTLAVGVGFASHRPWRLRIIIVVLDPDRMTKTNTGRGIRKTHCCIGRSRPISKRFSLASKNAAGKFRSLSNARCGPICLVACWPAVFCGSSVNRAARIAAAVLQRQIRLSVLLRKENGRYRSVLGGSRVSPVPARQWVLSLPFALRYRLAYDAEMVTAVRKLQQFTGCWRWRGN